MKMQAIETKRLVLREIQETDAGQIVAWRSDPEVYRYFTVPRKLTIEEHLDWYRNSYLPDGNRVDLIALDRDKRVPMGVFGIKKIGETSVEISYLMGPQYRGRGYAVEAVDALLHFAERTWGCKTAVAEIHKDNIPSIAFIKRLGFKEGKITSNFISLQRQL
jgi:RimJ/RimL family protein N-acetyltransferase